VSQLKLLLATGLLILAALASQASDKPQQIIIDTTSVIKEHINTTSQELAAIVDEITHTGRMSLFKALSASRRSKKKIKNTISQVESQLNEANNKIEEKTGQKQPIIRKKTGNLLAEAKNDIYTTHKKIKAKMMQALKNKRQADIVLQAARKSKAKIETFKTELTRKVNTTQKALLEENFI